MEYRIGELTEEEAVRIGEKINGIVPREVEADKEEFVLKIQGENGGIIGGCIAEAYEYEGVDPRICGHDDLLLCSDILCRVPVSAVHESHGAPARPGMNPRF